MVHLSGLVRSLTPARPPITMQVFPSAGGEPVKLIMRPSGLTAGSLDSLRRRCRVRARGNSRCAPAARITVEQRLEVVRSAPRRVLAPVSVSDPPVRLFIMGGGSGRKTPDGRLDHGGHWRDEADWPIPDLRMTSYFSHRGGRASRPSRLRSRSREPLTYDFDPAHTRCPPWAAPSLQGSLSCAAAVTTSARGPNFMARANLYLPVEGAAGCSGLPDRSSD